MKSTPQKTDLGFSVIRQKGTTEAGIQAQIAEQVLKTSQMFERILYASSPTKSAKPIAGGSIGPSPSVSPVKQSNNLNTENILSSSPIKPAAEIDINTDSKKLISEKRANLENLEKRGAIPVVICKKGRKLGKILYREGIISAKDIYKFYSFKSGQKAANINKYALPTPQDVKGNKVSYKLFPTPPLESVVETKQEYDALTKEQKKNVLPWEAKEIAGLNYRIRFRRFKPEKEGPSDTAFYFQNQEEWKEMVSLLRAFKLLQTNDAEQTTFRSLLKSLSDRFKLHMKKRFADAVAERALAIKASRSGLRKVEIPEAMLSFMNQFDRNVWGTYTARWKELAEKLEARKPLVKAVNKSSLLRYLNHRLTEMLSEAWSNKALEKALPRKEDLNILFNSLELPGTITNPSVKIEVKLLNRLSEPVIVNGRELTETPEEFTLSCLQREDKPKDKPEDKPKDKPEDKTEGKPEDKSKDKPEDPKKKINYWRIIAKSSDISEEQKKFVREAYIPSTTNLEAEKFSLHFQNFPLECLENIEINMTVSDQNGVKKAYYYTLLKGLQRASKKGKNIWLCLNTNESIMSLLQLKVETSNFAKSVNLNMIEDTFYNYTFQLPDLTPERVPLLEFLPNSWKIMDANTTDLSKSPANRAEIIKSIKSRLSKHYHETTSRQMALQKKSADVWAELQNDIMNYFPGKDLQEQEKSQLCADGDYLNLVTSQGEDNKEGENQVKNSGFVISYLLKRDLWESKTEWRTFYLKLEELCKMGLLPQNRLDIWSEMSRVVYFIKLTEKDLQQNKRIGVDQNAGFNTYDDILSRSSKIYDILKEDSQKNCSIFYQNLGDDINDLRASFGVSKLPFEHNLLRICMTFIYWAKIFSDPSKDENSRYLITYSRTVATLCYGLLVCQTYSLAEGNVAVEEHKIFWLLISLMTYILASYFETNEKAPPVDTLTFKNREDLSRKRNVITQSALRCNKIKGIKSDLLVLKFLLRSSKNEKILKVHEKFEELGLPLEYYFGEHMLSLFFNLFNPGLTFRIWDVLFLEGSSANQVKCNRMIICVLYALLQECADQIVQAREGSDIKFIIEMYARFQTNYNGFLKKCYQACGEHFEQAVPESEDFIGKLKLIQYALFSDEYNKIDRGMQKIEKFIESHFEQTLAQNLELYEFSRKKLKYNEGSDPEILSYPILTHIIHKFTAAYGNPIDVDDVEQDTKANQATKKCFKERATSIWIKAYSVTSPIEEVRKTTLKIRYGDDYKNELIQYGFNPLHVYLEGNFKIKEVDKIKVEICDKGNSAIVVKFAEIDLRTIPVNVVTKLNLRLNETEPDIYREDFAPSEIELAIIVETSRVPAANVEAPKKEVQPILIRDLEDIYYNDFRMQDIQNSLVSEMKADKDITDDILAQFSVLKRSLSAWKENFAMTSEEFIAAMKKIAPYWSESDLISIHASITKASRNSVFYVCDFFVLLILYVQGTLNQKYDLLFDFFTSFDPILPSRRNEGPPEKVVSLHDFKGLAYHLYDLFMIHIPFNQLENMIDSTATGHSNCIKQIIINEQIESAKASYPREALNDISNFFHVNTHSKDIPIQTDEILKFLKRVYDHYILPREEGRRSWLAKNTIDIIYFTDGKNHRLTIYVDQNWEPQEEAHQHDEQAILKLLDCYRNVIPLTTSSSLYNKDKFIQILQKLPLMNYLCSFENGNSTQTPIVLNDIKFTILMDNDPLITVAPGNLSMGDSAHDAGHIKKEKENFPSILRKWPVISRQAISRTSSPVKVGKPGPIVVPPLKVDPFLPLCKIFAHIKRTAMRQFIDTYNTKKENLADYQRLLSNEHFYDLDYDIILKLDGRDLLENIDPDFTPFLVIMDAIEKKPDLKQTQNLEIVFSLKDSIIPETYPDQYEQLANYRHPDGSPEWLPCKIVSKFQFGEINDKIDRNVVDGYGVVFESSKEQTFYKKTSDVIILQPVDMDELLLKRIDATYRANTVDQIAQNIEINSLFNPLNSPDRRNQQQDLSINNSPLDDPLTRNLQSIQKSK